MPLELGPDVALARNATASFAGLTTSRSKRARYGPANGPVRGLSPLIGIRARRSAQEDVARDAAPIAIARPPSPT
jgi:hypothetical protein